MNSGQQAAAAVGGTLYLVAGVCLIILWVAWIIFPFIVSTKLNKIIKLLKEQNELIEDLPKAERKRVIDSKYPRV